MFAQNTYLYVKNTEYQLISTLHQIMYSVAAGKKARGHAPGRHFQGSGISKTTKNLELNFGVSTPLCTTTVVLPLRLVSTAVELTPLGILKFIVSYGSDVFPNLKVGLQVMTIAVSVAGCERSFSKRKLILTHLRSTMSESRLTNLAILSIEREIADGMDFSSMIDSFASLKLRKVFI